MNTTGDGRHRTKVWLDDVRPSGEWKIIGSDVETHRHRPLNGEWMGWTMGRRVDQTQSDTDDNDEQEGGLADFNPVPKPISSGVTRTIERDAPIDDISIGEDDAIPSQYAKQYYQQYAPSFNSNSVPVSNIGGGEQSNMIEKMNYMIHLLEEQQDQKTNHVTEEIILYSFLGVFVIFVVDSFARVGKYVR